MYIEKTVFLASVSTSIGSPCKQACWGPSEPEISHLFCVNVFYCAERYFFYWKVKCKTRCYAYQCQSIFYIAVLMNTIFNKCHFQVITTFHWGMTKCLFVMNVFEYGI